MTDVFPPELSVFVLSLLMLGSFYSGSVGSCEKFAVPDPPGINPMQNSRGLRTTTVLIHDVVSGYSSCPRSPRQKNTVLGVDAGKLSQTVPVSSPDSLLVPQSPPSSERRSRPSSGDSDIFSFFPRPIDTSGMQLPECVIKLCDHLARNLHEVWALNKIEAGWSYAQRRDDVGRKHNCLTTYEDLTDVEREYDLTLTKETMKTLLTMGYELCDPDPTKVIREPSKMAVPESYRQNNGYKPEPFDLSSTELTSDVENLVEKLAANLHNVWAKNRIEQGWKFGHSEDNNAKRSPNLVPYEKIDLAAKKANRDSVVTIVKGLIAFGSDLCAPKPNQLVNQRNPVNV